MRVVLVCFVSVSMRACVSYKHVIYVCGLFGMCCVMLFVLYVKMCVGVVCFVCDCVYVVVL